MFAQIMLVFEAIKEGSKALQLLVVEVRSLRQDSIDKTLDEKMKEINVTVEKINKATTNSERTQLAHDLAVSLRK